MENEKKNPTFMAKPKKKKHYESSHCFPALNIHSASSWSNDDFASLPYQSRSLLYCLSAVNWSLNCIHSYTKYYLGEWLLVATQDFSK